MPTKKSPSSPENQYQGGQGSSRNSILTVLTKNSDNQPPYRQAAENRAIEDVSTRILEAQYQKIFETLNKLGIDTNGCPTWLDILTALTPDIIHRINKLKRALISITPPLNRHAIKELLEANRELGLQVSYYEPDDDNLWNNGQPELCLNWDLHIVESTEDMPAPCDTSVKSITNATQTAQAIEYCTTTGFEPLTGARHYFAFIIALVANNLITNPEQLIILNSYKKNPSIISGALFRATQKEIILGGCYAHKSNSPVRVRSCIPIPLHPKISQTELTISQLKNQYETNSAALTLCGIPPELIPSWNEVRAYLTVEILGVIHKCFKAATLIILPEALEGRMVHETIQSMLPRKTLPKRYTHQTPRNGFEIYIIEGAINAPYMKDVQEENGRPKKNYEQIQALLSFFQEHGLFAVNGFLQNYLILLHKIQHGTNKQIDTHTYTIINAHTVVNDALQEPYYEMQPGSEKPILLNAWRTDRDKQLRIRAALAIKGAQEELADTTKRTLAKHYQKNVEALEKCGIPRAVIPGWESIRACLNTTILEGCRNMTLPILVISTTAISNEKIIHTIEYPHQVPSRDMDRKLQVGALEWEISIVEAIEDIPMDPEAQTLDGEKMKKNTDQIKALQKKYANMGVVAVTSPFRFRTLVMIAGLIFPGHIIDRNTHSILNADEIDNQHGEEPLLYESYDRNGFQLGSARPNGVADNLRLRQEIPVIKITHELPENSLARKLCRQYESNLKALELCGVSEDLVPPWETIVRSLSPETREKAAKLDEPLLVISCDQLALTLSEAIQNQQTRNPPKTLIVTAKEWKISIIESIANPPIDQDVQYAANRVLPVTRQVQELYKKYEGQGFEIARCGVEFGMMLLIKLVQNQFNYCMDSTTPTLLNIASLLEAGPQIDAGFGVGIRCKDNTLSIVIIHGYERDLVVLRKRLTLIRG